MSAFDFAELETDAAAIAAFVSAENAATMAAFGGAQMEADIAQTRALLESPDVLRGLIRRGEYIYTFRQTAENPRGLWLRLPQTVTPDPAADWQVVFDLDKYCAETGQVWVWNGAETCGWNPDRVMLALSVEGSDVKVYREFDLSLPGFVAGGFEIGPDRGQVAWDGEDAILWSSAAGGDATRAGWPGTVRRVVRGADSMSAPVVFQVGADDLLGAAGVTRAGGDAWMRYHLRMPAIGMTEITLIREGRPDVTLPNPADSQVFFNHSHFAYVAQELGDHPAGSFVLGEIDGPGRWVLFAPRPRASVEADSISMGSDWLTWVETDALVPRLRAVSLRDVGAGVVNVALPVAAESVGISNLDANPDAGDETMILHLSGFLTPPQMWRFQMTGPSPVFTPFYAQPARFDASGMSVQLLHAVSADGTEVPYHLVLPRDAGGQVPVLQYGYGGFGVSLGPWYDAVKGATWLAQGGAYVQAYIRGGAEYGPEWHLAAKGAGRVKSFEDFVAVARDLVARGITVKDRIACHGGSNGGLLCGVMLTRYSLDFGGVWASVGVHDMLRFAEFPAGRGWIDEYGDPSDPEAAAWLRAYSPVHNVPVHNAQGGPLPAAYIDTSSHDDRVDPSHSRRFVAALQAAGHRPFYHEHRGGHGGGGASAEKAQEWALGLAFLRGAICG